MKNDNLVVLRTRMPFGEADDINEWLAETNISYNHRIINGIIAQPIFYYWTRAGEWKFDNEEDKVLFLLKWS